ncbi:hypothetical protein L873DRAFT_1806987 [Choiromyces venosus 120613-1]|uniref:Ubiquitin 3 binding protein But2 C-terminal domain-containing protein n=1 Tax=Choiromyces venosus 120613-1 TaxID=1336337 RepID=A0A3N4JLT1_9PEZI|nr:hypothetical protein L873DRAFT_1806987 [Choiromyces venosus 120613-1]
MKSAIFSAITIFATLATALPAAGPNEAAAENLVARNHIKQVINTSAVVNIQEDNPDTPLGVNNKAVVGRTGGKHNSQALVKFDFPAGLRGSKCQLAFGYPEQFSGSKEIQVLTVGDANIETATYNRRPYRDQFKGTFRVLGWGEAVVVDGSGLTFDCPAKGAQAYEVVSVGDINEVIWYAPWDGLRIDVS